MNAPPQAPAAGTGPGPIDNTQALAAGLAAHVQRWALARGATGAAALAAARAAQALSQHAQAGHVCIRLAALPVAVAGLPAPAWAAAGAGATSEAAWPVPADAQAWRSALLASQVVGLHSAPGHQPGNQPLVLDAEGRLYLHRMFDLECRLARRLLAASRWPAPPPDPQADRASAAQLASLFAGPGAAAAAQPAQPDWQMVAAALALRGRLTVVSGGPGTGKTTTVARLLACLLAREPGLRVVLAAPTGKAAARLAQALQQRAEQLPAAQRALLPAGASTVHRLLGVRPGRGGQPGTGEHAFLHDAAHPLPLDVLVLDEASMLDLALATRLLEAVPLHARIVLLGDKDQLAAVEAGAVFAELSADPGLSDAARADVARLCGLPAEAIVPPAPQHPGVLHDSVVWFNRNHRFAADAGIGRLAGDAVAGRSAALLATLRQGDPQLQWLDDSAAQPDATTLQACLAGYAAYADACRAALAAGRPDDAMLDALAAAFGRFRVLCALRDGPRGVAGINTWLGQRLRAHIAGEPQAGSPLPAAERSPWHAGRPVLVLRNDPAQKLFNGDIGLTLPLPGPGGVPVLQVCFPTADGRWRALAPARLPAHETAWAMTVHKAQGSEFERVLLLLPARPNRLLSRELLYTAVTRARSHVTLAAGAEVLAATVSASSQRDAGLAARLVEAAAGMGAAAGGA